MTETVHRHDCLILGSGAAGLKYPRTPALVGVLTELGRDEWNE